MSGLAYNSGLLMNLTSSCPSLVRLVYVANVRIPSEKAHVLQIFKNCEAFARKGVPVELFYPRRRTSKGMEKITDPFDYYQVDRNFDLNEMPSPDLISLGLPGFLGPLAFIAHTALFTRLVLRRIPRKLPSVLYTRDLIVVSILSLYARPYLLELHTLPRIGMQKVWKGLLARRTIGMIVISQHLAEDCMRAGVPRERLLVAPDAVDHKRLERLPNRRQARDELGLPLERPIAVYTGHLYPWKGVDTIIDCSRVLPELLFVVVGGLKDDVDRLARKVDSLGITNVRLEGYVPPARVADYLAAADILLLPNSASSPLSIRHTSPMKAFDYMAAERPVIASDLPSIGEIFQHEVNALLVPPDDPERLRAAIRRLLDEPQLRVRISREARRRVEGLTWNHRAGDILESARRWGMPLHGATPGVTDKESSL